MTKLTKILLITFFGACAASLASAQEILILKCEGDLETTLDTKKEIKRASVDVSINLASSTFEIQGYWGCTTSLGESMSSASKCNGTLPLLISDSEFRYGATSSNDNYDGTTAMVVNRYTGMLSVNSSGIAKPAANARWTLLLIGGRLQCTPQAKRF